MVKGNTSRIAAVAAGALIVVGLGATGAVGAGLITGADIKNGTIESADVARQTLTGSDIKDGAVTPAKLSDRTKAQIAAAGESGVQTATLTTPVGIANIGGKIAERKTDVDELTLDLEPGSYLVSLSGAFMSDVAAADPSVDVYPQLSLWLDKNADDAFDWQTGEGSISPNALMPTTAERHISVSGSTVIEVAEATTVKVLAFGYASDQGSARGGEIDVISGTLTATPLD